jgi:Mrp family chromosome partitioning ATPase
LENAATGATGAEDRNDLTALGAVLRRRLWLVILGAAVGVAGGLLFAHVQTKQYSSTASLLFRPVYLDVAATGSTLQVPDSDPTREVATDVSLVSQPDVMAAAARRLGPPYTATSLSKHYVNISSNGKTDLVAVKATAHNADEAARIADAVAEAYIAVARQTIVSQIRQAESRIRQELRSQQITAAQRLALQLAQTKLSVLALVGSGTVHLSQAAVPPTKPSSPRPVLAAAIGGIGGLVVGLALAFGAEQLDPRLRGPDEIERDTGLPLLATIPQRRALGKPVGGRSYHDLEGNEPFERLASVLRHLPGGHEIRTVLVTSTESGSGKTVVALRLGLAAAGGLSARTLLVETDLRNPQLFRLVGLPPDVGLGGMLSQESQESAVQTISLGNERVSVRDLAVLPAGPPSADASALLDSETMRNLISSWSGAFDLTVIDGPPPVHVADMIPLATQVDAVVIVVRLGKDSAREVRRLRVDLERLGVAPLGVVANFARPVKNPYAV